MVLVCLSIISVLVISSCKNKKPATTDNNSVSSTLKMPGERRPLDKLIKMPDANEVAATVNGTEIKEGEIQEQIAPIIESIQSNPNTSNLNAEAVNSYIRQKREEALQQLIIRCLLAPKVKGTDIVVTKDDAEKLIVERLQANAQGVGLEDFKKMLASSGRNYDAVIQDLRDSMVYEKFVNAQIADQLQVTEEEAKTFYDDNPKLFETPEQVRASHILVPFDANDPNNGKEQAKAKIEGILQQLKDGADFAELAKTTGGFPSAPRGGDLGYFKKGDMVPSFEDAAFQLETGQISDIVETIYGYHIIKVTDHKAAGVVSFEEAKSDITNYLKSKKENEAANKYYESLIKEATIKFPEGKELKTGLFATN